MQSQLHGSKIRKASIFIATDFPVNFLTILSYFSLCCILCSQNVIDLPATTDNSNIIMIGNSMQDEGIGFDTLSAMIGHKVVSIWSGGAMSAWKFCALWNAIYNDTENLKPKIAIVEERTNAFELTDPLYRTTGSYLDNINLEIGKDSVLHHIVYDALDSGLLVTNSGDFNSSFPYSFLAKMIKVTHDNGIQLIIVGTRSFCYAQDPLWETARDVKYKNDLTDYLRKNNVPFLDYSLNPEVMIEDYGAGDHLNRSTGRSKWTKELADDLASFLNKAIAFNDRTQFVDSETPTILLPSTNRIMVGGTKCFAQAKCKNGVLLSFYGDSNTLGERWFGTTDTGSIFVPQGIVGNRILYLFAYSRGHKISSQYKIVDSSGINKPPVVNTGPDNIAFLNVPYQMNGSVTDDSLPSNGRLTFAWSLMQGSATISDSLALNPFVTISQPGQTIFRLHVSDGILESFDDVTITVNQAGSFNIIEPTNQTVVKPGDTLHIQWTAVDVMNASIAMSVDSGKSFQETQELLSISDPSWGNFNLVVPLGTQPTSGVQIRIESYDRKTVALSALFSIISQAPIVRHSSSNQLIAYLGKAYAFCKPIFISGSS